VRGKTGKTKPRGFGGRIRRGGRRSVTNKWNCFGGFSDQKEKKKQSEAKAKTGVKKMVGPVCERFYPITIKTAHIGRIFFFNGKVAWKLLIDEELFHVFITTNLLETRLTNEIISRKKDINTFIISS
jgi:hypothetical protein